MDEHTSLRSTADGTNALEEVGVSVAAIAVVAVAFGSAYATVAILGGSLVTAVAAVAVGFGVLLAVPVGTTWLLEAVATEIEDRRDRPADRTPDTRPVHVHPDAREADD